MTWRLSVFSLKGYHQQQQCRCVLTGEEYKIFLIHGYQNICPLLILTSVCQVVQPFTLVSNLYTLYILSQTCMLLPSRPPGETSLYSLSTPGKWRLVFLQVFCFLILLEAFKSFASSWDETGPLSTFVLWRTSAEFFNLQCWRLTGCFQACVTTAPPWPLRTPSCYLLKRLCEPPNVNTYIPLHMIFIALAKQAKPSRGTIAFPWPGRIPRARR